MRRARRALTLVADSELPPRSKRLSDNETRPGAPSTADTVSTTATSSAVTGSIRSLCGDVRVGAGSAARSSLPLLVVGRSVSTVIVDGTIWGRR
ncbi:Uncharacterised protein [Mycobacteroides abscessus subsp. abscessus]|nr:Uncharacterised protein [Mycobacteroides abscessus subsp. abscessus]